VPDLPHPPAGHAGHAPLAEASGGEAEALRRALDACREERDALDRQLDALAFGISHELRAPLRSIDSFATRLAQRHAGALDDEGRDHLQRIRAAAAGMGGLVEGLIEWSRASRAPLRRQQVDLSLLAEWAGAELRERDPARPLRLAVAPGLAVSGDERLLRMVFEQLLDNAWKFADGDEVRVEVGGRRDAAAVQVWVRDWGRGFEMQYADQVFAPFKRLHPPEEGAGHGLGLAIARRIVERPGGRLGAESVPGVGSTFRLLLPAAPAEDPSGAGRADDARDQALA
jgi:signal transduction histidine kinase